MSRRTALFLGIVVLCVVGVGLFIHRSIRERQEADAAAAASRPLPALADGPPIAGTRIVFTRQSGSPDGRDRSVGVVAADARDAPRFVEALRCDRVDMSGGHGLCLARQGRFPISYKAVIFDDAFTPTAEVPLIGAPSRAQVSPDGRYGASTVFVAGHSYADMGFSTRTSILDLETGAWVIEDMETLTVQRDGRKFWEVDFNFWGVTFASDSHTFYMTLGTGGRTYLVRGAVGSDTVDVVAEDVECPSLSPDNHRLAYKQRVDNGIGPAIWNVWVLDLDSGERHALAETRNVDDQVQWLDEAHVLYALPGDRPAVMDTWVVSADGSGRPSIFLPESYSAVAVLP